MPLPVTDKQLVTAVLRLYTDSVFDGGSQQFPYSAICFLRVADLFSSSESAFATMSVFA